MLSFSTEYRWAKKIIIIIKLFSIRRDTCALRKIQIHFCSFILTIMLCTSMHDTNLCNVSIRSPNWSNLSLNGLAYAVSPHWQRCCKYAYAFVGTTTTKKAAANCVYSPANKKKKKKQNRTQILGHNKNDFGADDVRKSHWTTFSIFWLFSCPFFSFRRAKKKNHFVVCKNFVFTYRTQINFNFSKKKKTPAQNCTHFVLQHCDFRCVFSFTSS